MKEEIARSTPRQKRRRGSTAGGSGDSLTPSASSSAKVVVKDVWLFEEEEVDSRDPEKDLQLYKQSCGNIRRLMKSIVELKKTKKSAAEIAEKRIQASLLFATLKKLNRFEKIRNKKARDATNETKAKVDTHHLQLQNLLYEVAHLTKEVNKCLEFKSKDEDIELVTVEEFYEEAPPEISKPEKTKNDVHQQTLARLDWELEQRKRLAAQCKEAEANKDVISLDIKNKKEYLETLAPCLSAILKATDPLQDHLGMRHEVKCVQNKMAGYLPVPLFILFVQASAYAEAWDKKMLVVIEGDVDEAKALKESAEERDEESGDSDQEESQGDQKRYRRSSSTNRLTEMRRKVLKKHPLIVSITLKTKGEHTLKLEFSYVLMLHIVTVVPTLKLGVTLQIPTRDVLAPSVLFDCLFPDDTGTDTPNQANHYQLKRLGMDEFKTYVNELGRPYFWVQRASGLDFARSHELNGVEVRCPTIPSSKVSASHMEQIVVALRQRLLARIALQELLNSLEQGTITLNPEVYSLFPTKTTSRLASFQSLPWEDFLALPQVKRLVDDGIVKSSHFTFSAVLERGSAKLHAALTVSPDYPREPPIFVLRTTWKEGFTSLEDRALWDLEKEVNLYWTELASCGSAHRLLAYQLKRLLTCFDVYLETEGTSDAIEGPQEFAKEKVFFQRTKGRSRAKPYKYVPSLGLFMQR